MPSNYKFKYQPVEQKTERNIVGEERVPVEKNNNRNASQNHALKSREKKEAGVDKSKEKYALDLRNKKDINSNNNNIANSVPVQNANKEGRLSQNHIRITDKNNEKHILPTKATLSNKNLRNAHSFKE